MRVSFTVSPRPTPTEIPTESNGTFAQLGLAFPVAESAIADDMPSPWVACPRCACIWLKVTCVLERGDWQDENTYVLREKSEGPKVGAFITGLEEDSDEPKPIACAECGYLFELADVGYGGDIQGEYSE